jgi:TetR/AcrR family transcriptional regulator
MVNKSETRSSTTEEKILEAAKKVFIENGLDGTNMQQIADEAQINKSLLHYYFRTKEKLFGTVLKYAFKFIVPQIQDILNSNDHVFVKIELLVNEYIEMLMKNKFIPAFIMHEINRNPDSIFLMMKESGIDAKTFISQFMDEMKKGHIRQMDPRHLIINMLSLCIFPVAARPLMQRVFFENDDKAYKEFLEERKKVVADFIIQSIKV